MEELVRRWWGEWPVPGNVNQCGLDDLVERILAFLEAGDCNCGLRHVTHADGCALERNSEAP